MKATEATFLAFLKKAPQFIIPIYQRTYSWTEKQCAQLWEDILRTGADDDINVHFVGSVVYIEEGLSQVCDPSPLLVIDGQQRLATITLLLSALAQAIGDEDEPVNGFSKIKIEQYYLMNPLEKGDHRYKLLLSQTDRATLTSIVAGAPAPSEPSLRIQENFDYFRHKLTALDGDLTAACKGLSKLMLVDVALTRGQDNPQLIFESMNSTGKELSQADLIRNYVLMGLEPNLQEQLYTNYWRPMELEFGQEAYGEYFDAFMRHYLTVHSGNIPKIKEVYDEFKKYAETPEAAEQGVEGLVRGLRESAGDFCAFVLNREQDTALKEAFHDLRELKVEVAYPLLLELYHDYRKGMLSQDELLDCVRTIESYVFRRAICGIATNSMNRTFARFTKDLDKLRYLEHFKAKFLLLRSYRRFPNDDEFFRDIQTRDLYHFRSRSYWLRRIENFRRKERVFVAEYSIEHIMPQNENLSAEWRTALGDDWEEVRGRLLHTLGNLTLTGYNSEYYDHPFEFKRDLPEKGLRHSPLKLNTGLGSVESWNESAIQTRAKRLAGLALEVWPMPQLKPEVVEQYSKPSKIKPIYTIDDHPNLSRQKTKVLFEAFRTAVLDLDPCVTEEFLKLYVAYKAETNFVDVVPQAKNLRLTLNIRFPEIDDPREMCVDVTNRGRWGNGDVEVFFSELDDLPYILGLVRQSLEQQLGGVDSE